MKFAAPLFLGCFVATCMAQCNLAQNPQVRPKVICNEQGVFNGSVQPLKMYKAVDFLTCVQDLKRMGTVYPKAAAFNSDTGTCSIYTGSLLSSGFRKQKNSPTTVASTDCYILEGFCPPENDSFETITKGKEGKNSADYVGLVPWSEGIGRTAGRRRIQSRVTVVTPSDLPNGAQPAPDGNNFALFTMVGNDILVVEQYVTVPAGDYIFSLQYAFIEYQPAKIGDNPDYYQVILDLANSTSFTLTPTDENTVNGSWNSYQFALSFSEAQNIGLEVLVFGYVNSSSTRALIGFDQIQLTQAQTTTLATG